MRVNFSSIILLLLLIVSCTQTPPHSTTEFSGIAMTIPYKITIGEVLTKEQIDEIEGTIQSVFHRIDRVYNKWNPDSELSQLNGLKADEIHELSDELYQFFSIVDEIYHITNSYFDPTIESIQQLWKQHLNVGLIPDRKEIITLLSGVGWRSISFKNGVFCKSADSTSLDLGGIAKGYAVDLISETLKEQGYNNHLVDWGGDLRASGKHPENRLWRVYVRSPDSAELDHAIAIIELNNEAIATSGNYLQYWKVRSGGEDKLFTHIINPITGAPLPVTKDTISSVSVTAKTCLLADALATAAMIYPTKAEAVEWLESLGTKYPDMRYRVETANREL